MMNVTPAFVATTALTSSLRATPIGSSHATGRAPQLAPRVAHTRTRVCPAAPRCTATQPTQSEPLTSPPPTETDVLIIGAGVSGTALAHTLQKDHADTSLLLTEARAIVGGNVTSRMENGYIWEEGPNTYQPAPHIMRLAVDVGLKDDIVLADSTLPRFVYWDDELYALPMGPADIPKFRLLSLGGLIRAGLGALGFVRPYFKNDESVRDFITRHLGEEVFKKMIDPFVSGVYAGDPSKLCMSAAFKKIFALQNLGFSQGIIEGAIYRIQEKKRTAPPPDPDLPTWRSGALGSFKNGLAMLPNAIANRLGDRVKLEWTLVGLEREADGRFRAEYDTPQGRQTVRARSVALTAPARAAASVLRDVAPGAKRLEEINYPTVWSITLAYPKSEFKEPLSGFGNLIPRSMGIRTLGTIWSSCLFPGRAPDGMELLLSYIGGAQDEAIKGLSEKEVVAQVDADIKKILMKEGCDVAPVVVGAKRWERAIPQYNIGYWDIMEETQQSVGKSPGIFLGGNYTSGVAFGDCVLWGVEGAAKIAEYVKQSSLTNA